MRNPVQERGCHLGIHCPTGDCKANLPKGAGDRDPFTELQVGGDDDAGFLIELADEVEQERAARLWKRDVTQLVRCPAGHASRAREGMMTQSSGVSCRIIFPAFPSACSLIRALIRSTALKKRTFFP